MMQSNNKFLNLVNHPFLFRLYLFIKLPAAFFSGIRIRECSNSKCITSVPYKWLTQNPFRSTYFASLAMAAELSTGALALNNTYKRNPEVSMLVTKMEASYFKKATGITFFTCNEGHQIENAVKEARNSGEAKVIIVKSIGKNKSGELIAEFFFTWSFKTKSKKNK
ncbi:MAG: DUF4442 domain-containing protein [Bacteroidota bacterium]|nr:DUF4442 domain-containing protein [Bacteroidota bacterium]